jgi:hypothetical protein
MDKVEHLKMIQDIINRLAGNSFLAKSWCVTLVAAIMVLGTKEADKKLILVAFFPIAIFWLLDAYFLRQERLFRKLYDTVRIRGEEEIDFSMDTSVIHALENQRTTWINVAFSKTLIVFYAGMLIAVLFMVLLVYYH